MGAFVTLGSTRERDLNTLSKEERKAYNNEVLVGGRWSAERHNKFFSDRKEKQVDVRESYFTPSQPETTLKKRGSVLGGDARQSLFGN